MDAAACVGVLLQYQASCADSGQGRGWWSSLHPGLQPAASPPVMGGAVSSQGCGQVRTPAPTRRRRVHRDPFVSASPESCESCYSRGERRNHGGAPLSWLRTHCGGTVISRINPAARGPWVSNVEDSLSKNLAVALLCALHYADPAARKWKRLPPRCATCKYTLQNTSSMTDLSVRMRRSNMKL